MLSTAAVLAAASLVLSASGPGVHVAGADARAALLSNVVECEVDLDAPAITCRDVRSRGPAVLENPDRAVALQWSRLRVRRASSSASVDLGFRNLLPEPVGSPLEGPAWGSKLLLVAGPTATGTTSDGDTGAITLQTVDGTGRYTAADQPYRLYDEVVGPGAASKARRWTFHVPRAVSRFTFSVRVLTTVASEPGVPEFVPDRFPGWVFDPENMLDASSLGRGPYPRDVVAVRFRADAMQEERQAAIDLVRGTVIGGVCLAQVYMVQIPDDGTASPLEAAVPLLRSLPQVHSARVEWTLTTSSRVEESPPGK